MKGDFSRLTFDPQKNYSGVRMQQGRVQLDSDWNEQADIQRYRLECAIEDFVGRHGTSVSPSRHDDFAIEADGDALYILPGRYYVEGRMAENHRRVRFTEQPGFTDTSLPTRPGAYVAYLDVWERLVTALEDSSIREPALGGADTAARTHTAWRVRMHYLHGAVDDTERLSDLSFASDWQPTDRSVLSTGLLTPQLDQDASIQDNRLYRVEVHKGGPRAHATFKWSRDNGAVAARGHVAGDHAIVFERSTMSPLDAFAPGTWVEVVALEDISRDEPGALAQVLNVNDDTLTLRNDGEVLPHDHEVLVRRWDSPGAVAPDENRQIVLEHGLRVVFSAASRDGGTFNSGDYWLLPARANTGSIDWPRGDDDQFVERPAHGTWHTFAPLALVTRSEKGSWQVIRPLRRPAVPLTDINEYFLPKTGSVTLDGSLTVTDTMEVQGTLTANWLTVTNLHPDDPEGGGQLKVDGTAYVAGGAVIDNYLTVNGMVSVNGALAADQLVASSGDGVEVIGMLTLQTGGQLPQSAVMELIKRKSPGSILWGVFVEGSEQPLVVWKDFNGKVQGGFLPVELGFQGA